MLDAKGRGPQGEIYGRGGYGDVVEMMQIMDDMDTTRMIGIMKMMDGSFLAISIIYCVYLGDCVVCYIFLSCFVFYFLLFLLFILGELSTCFCVSSFSYRVGCI